MVTFKISSKPFKSITFLILFSYFLEGIISSENQTLSKSIKLFRNKREGHSSQLCLLLLSIQSELGIYKLPPDKIKL